MNHKEFTEKCIFHGFTSKKQCFFRCIGDGVFQTIRVNESCYVDPCSPYYSSKSRRTKRIAIGLYSIYASLPELWFDPRFGAGQIDANNLVGRRDLPFFGIQDHYDIMKNTGFDYLDGINTQKLLVHAIENLRDFKPSLILSQEMCIPYLICGENKKARRIIDSFLQNEHFLTWCTETCDGDLQRETRQRTLRDWQELETLTVDNGKLADYMRKSMLRNIKNAESHGLQLIGKFDSIV